MINGIINIKKEKGYTSHDVVAKLRGIIGQRKIGHTGTLDPDATGVLPVCLGRGTKLCDMLTDKNKTYVTTMLLGMVTDTQDISGEILAQKDVSELQEEDVEKCIYSFLGEYEQIPPMYSALKVNGRKLYELAREGKTIERQSRPVQILDIHIIQMNLPEVTMSVTCSKGTYIRTLCHDVGEKLHVGGCMKELTRTQVSCFGIQDSLTLHEVQELKDSGRLRSHIQSVDSVFYELERWDLPQELEWLAWNGNILKVQEFANDKNPINTWTEDQRIRVYDTCDRFIGIYKYKKENQLLKLEKMFLDKEELQPKSAITLGKFDGFHRGHQKLLEQVMNYERENPETIKSVVFAFDMNDYRKSHHIPNEQLMLPEERRAFLEDKVSSFVEYTFDEKIRTMTAEKFISKILVEQYRAEYVVVGRDFRFGYQAQGDVSTLKRYEDIYQYKVIDIEKETQNGHEISSTYIKEELMRGHVRAVNEMLGYTYSISGEVVHGKCLGRTIGFPTMNIIPQVDKALLKKGVYLVEVELDGSRHKGIANLGNKPTVNENGQILIETFVFDYSGDAYGEEICVDFLEFMREETKFNDVTELKEQINKDMENARKILFTI